MSESDTGAALTPELVECNSPADLLRQLDPSAPRWEPGLHGRWGFRGQGDANWALLPRALRQGEILSFRDASLRGPLKNEDDQRNAELQLVHEFAELADELGFALPGDLADLRFPWKSHESGVWVDRPWPWTSILEVVALAQHHGVPTRLLDFTLDPLVAAFFAAQKQIAGAKALAIWAIDLDFVANAWPPFNPGVRVVPVSRAQNPFLHAQSGLFLYDATGSRTPLDGRILSRDLRAANHLTEDGKVALAKSRRVIRFTLPVTERLSLVKELERRRVTDAHLRPTLDNVTEELRRRAM